MSDFVPWLRGLAAKGGKGVVDNIDARCLRRLADEMERLEAKIERLRDVCLRQRDRDVEKEVEVERLRAALREMLETHGKPRREEWLNEAAFEHAKAVDERARRALENARRK